MTYLRYYVYALHGILCICFTTTPAADYNVRDLCLSILYVSAFSYVGATFIDVLRNQLRFDASRF